MAIGYRQVLTSPLRTALFGAVLLALGGLALATGVLPAKDAAALGIRVWPILLFVVAITVVAELATAAGLFDWIAALAAGWGHRRGWLLWLLIALIAVVSTVFLSLDTTAVLLTPIVIVLARRVGLNPLPFALTTVWLANTASLLLPVSNLTNLLAEQHLGGIGPGAFAAAVWPAQLVGVVVPLALVAVLFRRELDTSYDEPGPVRLADRRLTAIAGVVLVLLVVGLVSGVAVWIPAGAAAVVLVAAFSVLRPRELSVQLLPWPTLVLVCGLFLAAAAARHQHPLVSIRAVRGPPRARHGRARCCGALGNQECIGTGRIGRDCSYAIAGIVGRSMHPASGSYARTGRVSCRRAVHRRSRRCRWRMPA